MNRLQRTFKEFKRYPSAIAGLMIIVVLIAVSIYAVIALPYSEAVRLWRGGVDVWTDSPKNAQPIWVNLFRKDDLPRTIIGEQDHRGRFRGYDRYILLVHL
jgi:peptide/nickel transport system permease protein